MAKNLKWRLNLNKQAVVFFDFLAKHGMPGIPNILVLFVIGVILALALLWGPRVPRVPGVLMLMLVLLIALLTLIVFVRHVISKQIHDSERLKLILEVSLVVGLGVVIAILQMSHDERIADRQIKQTEEIAERQEYAIAVEHLSSASPAVRLKGVRDLYKHADTTNDKKARDDVWEILQDQAKYFTRDKNYQAGFSDNPSRDIQEIINILTRRTERYEKSKAFDYGSSSTRIDLSKAYLRGAYFKDAHLQAADFREAQLQGAIFGEAQLQGAIFGEAQLQGARFWEAQLQGAIFWRAQLQGARFWRAQLQGARFWEAQLQGADFGEAQLQAADFREAQLQAADFRGAQLQGARFREAQLQGADFGEAQLQAADFREAQLQGADFWKAQLQGADFWEAQLQGADFREAQLQGADFWKAQLQGADFREAQLQGADFWKAQLQGAYSTPIYVFSFEGVISERVDKDADMRGAIVKGGLTEEGINEMEKGFNLKASYWKKSHKERLTEILQKLRAEHVGEKVIGSDKWLQELENNQRASIGQYTKQEADKWIKKYNKATGQEKGAQEKE